MKRLVILNPHSRHGTAGLRFAKERDRWQRELGGFDVRETRHPGHATELVRDALQGGGVDQLLVAGGDGTIHEALCGYWRDDAEALPTVPLGILNLGTGGDLHRTVTAASGDYRAALIHNRSRLVDVGTVRAGAGPSVPFLNIASVGMAGAMLRSLKASSFQSGSAAYFYHTIKTLFRFHPVAVRATWRDPSGSHDAFEGPLYNLFACNGRFSGGGMEWAPTARLDSGVLGFTLVTGTRRWPLVRHSSLVYRGRIAEFPGAITVSATSLTVRAASPLSLETDGEIADLPGGGTPEFTFDVHPRVFPLVV
jgi:diacylglycerol kinase family enzyme